MPKHYHLEPLIENETYSFFRSLRETNTKHNRMNTKTSIRPLLAGLLALPIAASAAPLVTPSLSGTTEYEGWENLTNTNAQVVAAENTPSTADDFPGFSNFTDPWPEPFDPNITGSAGNAGFDKVSGSGYPASEAIYSFPGFPPAPPVFGTFSISNSSALAGLETVAVQLDLGEGNGFFNAGPVLNYNGGAQQLAPDFTQSGPGPTAFTNPQTGNPSSTTLFGYQWDLSGITGGFTSYSIEWTTEPHVTTYNLRLDSSDTFSGNAITAVPEPASYTALLGLLALGFTFLRRRRRDS